MDDVEGYVYTIKEYIDRAEADQMLMAFMAKLGYANIRLKWKRPKLVLTPV